MDTENPCLSVSGYSYKISSANVLSPSQLGIFVSVTYFLNKNSYLEILSKGKQN